MPNPPRHPRPEDSQRGAQDRELGAAKELAWLIDQFTQRVRGTYPRLNPAARKELVPVMRALRRVRRGTGLTPSEFRRRHAAAREA